MASNKTHERKGDEMTDAQVLAIQAGDYIDVHVNGRVHNVEVTGVRTTGRCVNERSGAYGHAYACLSYRYTGSNLEVSTSIHSDEYTRGQGYATHDQHGNRVSGWQLVGHNALA